MWEALTKKIPAKNASDKAKEKAEPRTRIASRLSLGCVDKKDTHVIKDKNALTIYDFL